MRIRHGSLFASAVLAATVVGVVGGNPAPASSQPTQEAATVADCQYTMSSPELVIRPGGGKTVRASLTPTGCTSSAQPTDVVVCLSTPNGHNDCSKKPGWALVEVMIPASPPGGVFTATGKGCWQDILNSFTPDCRSTGPITATFQ